MLEKLYQQTYEAVSELIRVARLQTGDLMVIGCSSSEIGGQKIGTDSHPEIAESVFRAAHAALSEKGIDLAAQCCEHLNRALILERDAMLRHGLCSERVNVVPQPKAGGSFATAAYRGFSAPVAVEHLRADAGLDIGSTLIGMHLREVAVPVRLSVTKIGEAGLTAARTRLKFVGGVRAVYDEELL